MAHSTEVDFGDSTSSLMWYIELSKVWAWPLAVVLLVCLLALILKQPLTRFVENHRVQRLQGNGWQADFEQGLRTAGGSTTHQANTEPPFDVRRLVEIGPGAAVIAAWGSVARLVIDAAQRISAPQSAPGSVRDMVQCLQNAGVLPSDTGFSIMRLHAVANAILLGEYVAGPLAKQGQDPQMARQLVELAEGIKPIIAQGLRAFMERRRTGGSTR